MSRKGNRSRSIYTITGFILGLLIVFSCLQSCSKSFEKELQQASSDLNKTCPTLIDKETRLDNTAVLPGSVFQYNYTMVNIVKDSVNVDEVQKIMEPSLINSVKTNPDLKIYRDNKVTLAYNYKDKNGVFVLKISVTPEKYEK